jgi:CRISPR system Cascade subunit CasE
MMYLSRLILDPRSRRVRKEIANLYEMHRSIMSAFPDDLEKGDERVLFRLESRLRGDGLTLLVQSWTLPDWSWLADPGARGYLLPVDEPNPDIKSFDLNLATGQTLAFRLRANPTIKRWLPKDKNNPTSENKAMRIGIYDEKQQRQWLTRKAEKGGFRLLSVRTQNALDVRGWAHHEDVKHKLKLFAVRFDGMLQVTDPEALWETVRHGIGPGKGLGFGLLSLARPS